MSHLGDRVTALVDGELAPDVAERAYAHAAMCRSCRDALETERLMKGRLRAMTDCGPSPDLMLNLLAMAAPGGPVRPREQHMPGMPWASPVQMPTTVPARVPVAAASALPLGMPASGGPGISRRPAGRPETATRPAGRTETSHSWLSGRSGAQRRLALAVIGAVGAVGVGAVGVGAGTATGSAPRVSPAVDSFVFQRAASTRNLPFSYTGTTTWQVLLNSGGTGH